VSDATDLYRRPDTHMIASRHVRQVFQVQVAAPPVAPGDELALPVVFAADGNAAFDMLKGICWLLQGEGRDWPPFYLVGIGYPGHAPNQGGLLRARDFTFGGCPDYFSGHPLAVGLPVPSPGTKTFGGADDFQAFLADELFAFISERYPAARGRRVYFGHSMAGAFGLYTLLARPELFDAYLLSSPALSYSGILPATGKHAEHDFLLKRTRQHLGAGGGFGDRHVYVSVGSEEDRDAIVASWQFTSNVKRLVAAIREAPAVADGVTAELLDGHNHLTAWPTSFLHAVYSLFNPARKPHGTAL
jgi:predicted alpha/beta superfamily hydrolase